MKILFLGDVVGPAGCNAIKNFLPNIVKKNQIDFVIVNGDDGLVLLIFFLKFFARKIFISKKI